MTDDKTAFRCCGCGALCQGLYKSCECLTELAFRESDYKKIKTYKDIAAAIYVETHGEPADMDEACRIIGEMHYRLVSGMKLENDSPAVHAADRSVAVNYSPAGRVSRAIVKGLNTRAKHSPLLALTAASDTPAGDA